jgi:hypothetical protein
LREHLLPQKNHHQGLAAMTLSFRYFINALISNAKVRRATPRLNLSRFSDHDLRDINLPPKYRHHTDLSHELDDWRTRVLR